MEYLKTLNGWVKLTGGVLTICVALYGGWVWAGDLVVWASDAKATFATKEELQATNSRLSNLRKTLPIEVELRFKRSEIDQLSTIIMYGEEHDLDVELDKLKKQGLRDKVIVLEAALRRAELESE